MPVRKIPKNYRNVTGIAPHRKAEGPAAFESTLERDFIALLEFSREARRFEVQPVAIPWLDGQGKPHRYTPDVLVHYRSGLGATFAPRLCEVKYRSDLRENWAILRPKFKAAIRYARSRGWRFKIVTEKEIRTPYLGNVRFLLPFVHQGPESDAYMDLLDDAIIKLRESDPDGLIRAVFQDEWRRATLLPTLWYLVGTRQIGADLSLPLTMKSRLWSLR